MRLKILMMPFAILISLVIVIGYVKPEIEMFQEKKVLFETKETQARGMTALLESIKNLTTSLEAQSETEYFVAGYLPKDIDQERVVDMFNYLASQSGVLVSNMAIKETAVGTVGDTPDIGVPSDPSLPVVTSSKPKIKAYIGSVEVKGDYAGIKVFLDRVNHMNRFHKILTFSIAKSPSTSEEEIPGILMARLESRFEYFPMQKHESALGLPVFSKKEVGGSDWSLLQNWVKSTVPPLVGSDTGRPNPFQP